MKRVLTHDELRTGQIKVKAFKSASGKVEIEYSLNGEPVELPNDGSVLFEVTDDDGEPD